jgi:type II secretory pathway component PulK
MRWNERGIALVITLLVVALLAITVVEFTYSVEVDQHMARNALNGLQASLLARSGINLGEAFLLHDDDANIDSFTEEWCPQPGPEGHSCQIDEESSQLVVPENMRLRVEIFDEAGKLNINLTRPTNLTQLRAARAAENKSQQSAPFQAWYTAFTRLLEGRGVDPQVADEVMAFWEKVLEATQSNQPGARPGSAGGATPGGLAPARPTPTPYQVLLDFPSLDDASVIPGMSPGLIRRLRPVLTAGRGSQVNANTASREVLTAIVGDGEVVDSIISLRQEQGLKPADLARLTAPLRTGNDPANRFVGSMLGVKSSYFLIRASAIVNPNPVTGRGGVSRSASMLVQRGLRPGVPLNAPPGTPRWTLHRLDWQKEGGAVLFDKADQGTDADDSSTLGVAE